MLKIEQILCPVDFSEFAAKAYDYAYSLAEHYEAKLYVEHVIEVLTAAYPYYNFPDVAGNSIYWDLNEGAEKRLQEMVNRRTPDGLRPKVVVHKGFLPDSILSFAEDQQADLIVMGTHGRRGLDRLVMGSVTEGVLRKAHCPVLAVRKPAHDFVNLTPSEDPVDLQKILLCTDFSNCASTAAAYALSLAQEYNSEIMMLHVLEDFPQDGAETLMREAQRKLEALVPEDARNWCKVKTTVRIGRPYEEIIQVALEQQADVAVLGVRGRSAVDLAIFGSTTHRVLQLGPCPVLAVHDDRGD
ncbi:MAG TPA: universal stress protein [Terriglobia bacterium]|nr:universal stress protein [Terriglobia bacterium]